MKGSYVLIINLPKVPKITVGSLGEVHFPRGYYAYVGSALGDLESRLKRYLQRKQKPHWHIDYLRQKACLTALILGETKDKVECAIAQILSAQFDAIPGFGSSDCHCPSHLFFATGKRPMKSAITTAFASLAIPPKLIELRGRPK